MVKVILYEVKYLYYMYIIFPSFEIPKKFKTNYKILKIILALYLCILTNDIQFVKSPNIIIHLCAKDFLVYGREVNRVKFLYVQFI